MLRQVYIILNEVFLYERNYGKSFGKENFETTILTILDEIRSKYKNDFGYFDYYKSKIAFLSEADLNLFFIFILDLGHEIESIKTELSKFKNEFLNLFGNSVKNGLNSTIIETMNPFVDTIHSSLKPKISLIGFSGVGKTTISKLIKAEEIPLEHIPTINGEVAIIKLGKLQFFLWDFAGQEQFSFLWNTFIRGSDAVLLISDSTLENIEKSKYFLDLIKEEAPYAYTAIIGNKQDLTSALKIEEIERILGIKTYSFVAIDSKNRIKMIQIIADILEINTEISPLLNPIFERDKLIDEAQEALEKGDFRKTMVFFEKLSDLCLSIGDDALALEFYDKSVKLMEIIEDYQL